MAFTDRIAGNRSATDGMVMMDRRRIMQGDLFATDPRADSFPDPTGEATVAAEARSGGVRGVAAAAPRLTEGGTEAGTGAASMAGRGAGNPRDRAARRSGLDLDEGLRQLGLSAFRAGQREAIHTLLEARRLLLVAPTGGGKSLTYQLPAALLPGTTVVVSPLIALMHDQVAALDRRGVAATYLAGTLPPRRGTAAGCRRPRGRLQAGLRRSRTVGQQLAAGRAGTPRVSAGGRRRGALHQRLGT